MTETSGDDVEEWAAYEELSEPEPSSGPALEPDAEDRSGRPAADASGSRAGTAGRVALICFVVAILGLPVAAPILSYVVPGGVYVVASDSMEPTIPTGSLVVAVPDEPEVGDVVVYEAVTDQLEVHRVVDVDRSGQPTYTTQGDNNAASDSYLVQADQIQGEVGFHLPYMGGFWLLPLWLRGLLLGAGAGLYILGELREEPAARPDRHPDRLPQQRRDPRAPVGGR